MKEMDNILQGYVEEIEFLLEDDFVPVVEFLLVDPLSKNLVHPIRTYHHIFFFQ